MKKIHNLLRELLAVTIFPTMIFGLVAIASAQGYGSSDYYGSSGAPSSSSNPVMPNQNNNYNSGSYGNSTNMYPGTSNVSAPTITISSTDSSSATMQVSYQPGAGMSGTVQVYVWNEDTNATAMRSYNVMFDSQGNAIVMVGNLKSGTNYAFFAKVASGGNQNFSDPSAPVLAKTM